MQIVHEEVLCMCVCLCVSFCVYVWVLKEKEMFRTTAGTEYMQAVARVPKKKQSSAKEWSVKIILVTTTLMYMDELSKVSKNYTDLYQGC